ncbi:MAG: phosphate-starvation-inducible PsiE family protein [Oscillatoriaceae bacterium SKW80]|nr:phosphate-starvation-inducible PsiE family protein [Oscillatoriaceae bacterium SKYG93]MCX8120176.1 phosphate-starvation-inducible PsiE family protein [Oscillatoriaceae bacterium SKW80]MDW8453102.1 phosphate-starvation-inducible PsiE family protein [Oscillatoriaceae cyanobacterium SKYGB_i_bin93]HIK28987.1 phosphate-starvation-inducible PsiE family protein [Oscillatoriaceae cyanobacterium M7585_C2015_266]
MSLLRNIFKTLKNWGKDESFLHWLEKLEGIVSKILSLAMVIVIIEALVNLAVYIATDLFLTPTETFTKTLFKTFGLFLNVLIALEILENITAYLKKHVVQVELVIVTSLIAVARKIIILDLEKVSGLEIIGLAIAIFSLSISYLIIRTLNSKIRD